MLRATLTHPPSSLDCHSECRGGRTVHASHPGRRAGRRVHRVCAALTLRAGQDALGSASRLSALSLQTQGHVTALHGGSLHGSRRPGTHGACAPGPSRGPPAPHDGGWAPSGAGRTRLFRACVGSSPAPPAPWLTADPLPGDTFRHLPRYRSQGEQSIIRLQVVSLKRRLAPPF